MGGIVAMLVVQKSTGEVVAGHLEIHKGGGGNLKLYRGPLNPVYGPEYTVWVTFLPSATPIPNRG
jgi:hypothetical protein